MTGRELLALNLHRASGRGACTIAAPVPPGVVYSTSFNGGVPTDTFPWGAPNFDWSYNFTDAAIPPMDDGFGGTQKAYANDDVGATHGFRPSYDVLTQDGEVSFYFHDPGVNGTQSCVAFYQTLLDPIPVPINRCSFVTMWAPGNNAFLRLYNEFTGNIDTGLFPIATGWYRFAWSIRKVGGIYQITINVYPYGVGIPVLAVPAFDIYSGEPPAANQKMIVNTRHLSVAQWQIDKLIVTKLS